MAPNLGRFISVDPVFEASDPQSWSGHVYADNDPVTQSDPSGNFPCSWCKSIAKKTFAKVWVKTIDVGFHALGRLVKTPQQHSNVQSAREWIADHISARSKRQEGWPHHDRSRCDGIVGLLSQRCWSKVSENDILHNESAS